MYHGTAYNGDHRTERHEQSLRSWRLRQRLSSGTLRHRRNKGHAICVQSSVIDPWWKHLRSPWLGRQNNAAINCGCMAPTCHFGPRRLMTLVRTMKMRRQEISSRPVCRYTRYANTSIGRNRDTTRFDEVLLEDVAAGRSLRGCTSDTVTLTRTSPSFSLCVLVLVSFSLYLYVYNLFCLDDWCR